MYIILVSNVRSDGLHLDQSYYNLFLGFMMAYIHPSIRKLVSAVSAYIHLLGNQFRLYEHSGAHLCSKLSWN